MSALMACSLVLSPMGEAFREVKSRVGPIVPVGARPLRRHPARPAEPGTLPEPDREKLSGGNGELDVPVELLAEIEINRIGQLLRQFADRQEALIVSEALDEDPQPELVLDRIHRAAEEGILPQAALAGAKAGAFALVEGQP